MDVSVAGELLEEPSRRDGLQLTLALELQLPVRDVVCEYERSERPRRLDLGDEGRAGEIGRPRGDVQVDLVDVSNRPAARDRRALAVGLPCLLVGDVEAGAEQVDDLVVLV